MAGGDAARRTLDELLSELRGLEVRTGGGPLHRLDAVRQTDHGRRFEHPAQRELDVERLAEA